MRFESQDAGQMMLLAAVVLVVAFLSLSVMVGRIATIEGQTLRDVDQPLLAEAAALHRGVCAALSLVAGGGAGADARGNASLALLELQLAGRGYAASLQRAVGNYTVTDVDLRHGASHVAFRVVNDLSTSANTC